MPITTKDSLVPFDPDGGMGSSKISSSSRVTGSSQSSQSAGASAATGGAISSVTSLAVVIAIARKSAQNRRRNRKKLQINQSLSDIEEAAGTLSELTNLFVLIEKEREAQLEDEDLPSEQLKLAKQRLSQLWSTSFNTPILLSAQDCLTPVSSQEISPGHVPDRNQIAAESGDVTFIDNDKRLQISRRENPTPRSLCEINGEVLPPSISDSGNLIAFSSSGQVEIIESDGNGRSRVSNLHRHEKLLKLRLSGLGNTIIYCYASRSHEDQSEEYRFSAVDAETKIIEILDVRLEQPIQALEVSADGETIAFTTEHTGSYLYLYAHKRDIKPLLIEKNEEITGALHPVQIVDGWLYYTHRKLGRVELRRFHCGERNNQTVCELPFNINERGAVITKLGKECIGPLNEENIGGGQIFHRIDLSAGLALEALSPEGLDSLRLSTSIIAGNNGETHFTRSTDGTLSVLQLKPPAELIQLGFSFPDLQPINTTKISLRNLILQVALEIEESYHTQVDNDVTGMRQELDDHIKALSHHTESLKRSYLALREGDSDNAKPITDFKEAEELAQRIGSAIADNSTQAKRAHHLPSSETLTSLLEEESADSIPTMAPEHE